MPLVPTSYQIRQQAGPPGSYSMIRFGYALTPLWRKLGFRHDRTDDCLRAKLLCERLYQELGAVMRLEEVYETAEALAEVVEPGQAFPDIDRFLPNHRPSAILHYEAERKKPSRTRKDLTRLGYRF